MDSIIDRLNNIEGRLNYIEEVLGLHSNDSKDVKKKKVETEPENTVGGFTKSQLRVMFNWAKGVKLQQLSKSDFEELKKWGMLKDFYPDAPDRYEDIIL